MIKTTTKGADFRSTITNFHAEVPTHVAPIISATIIKGGVRYYRDPNGRLHIADVVDKIFTPQVLIVKKKGYKGVNPCTRIAVLQ